MLKSENSGLTSVLLKKEDKIRLRKAGLTIREAILRGLNKPLLYDENDEINNKIVENPKYQQLKRKLIIATIRINELENNKNEAWTMKYKQLSEFIAQFLNENYNKGGKKDDNMSYLWGRL